MFLHRGFFAQALADNPTNPLKSAHSQSFLTAYKCACEILDCTRDHYARQQRLVPRVWRIWSNAFSAAVRDITWIAITVRFDFEIYFQVIIGTVAIRTLNAGIEPPPLNKLDHACELFQSAAESSSAIRGEHGQHPAANSSSFGITPTTPPTWMRFPTSSAAASMPPAQPSPEERHEQRSTMPESHPDST